MSGSVGFCAVRVAQVDPGSGNGAVTMIDLQGGVVDLVGPGEQGFEVAAHLVAVAGGVDQDVGRQGRHPGGDVPDVQVVDLGDTGPIGHGRADEVGVEPFRGAFEEDPAGIPVPSRIRL